MEVGQQDGAATTSSPFTATLQQGSVAVIPPGPDCITQQAPGRLHPDSQVPKVPAQQTIPQRHPPRQPVSPTASRLQRRAQETFRVSQYAFPHPGLAQPAAAALLQGPQPAGRSSIAATGEVIRPDTGRVVLHFDIDAFYAQVEELRNPSLRERPMGVTQKYLIVTCNYPARACGVTKLMGIVEAKQRCPQLVLVSGEDLTPYRHASKRLLGVLQRFGTAERLGMDEALLDVTAEARARLARGSTDGRWHGHIHSSKVVVQGSRHRPMDLRPVSAGEPGAPKRQALHVAGCMADAGTAEEWEALLKVGSAIAEEARTAIKAEAGFRSSSGIACNRMLAKLASGLHKPDDQTVLPPPEAADFVAPLPVRALPGVGYKTNLELQAMGVSSTGDLRAIPRPALVQRFGERTAAFLYQACRGQDPTPVVEKGPPKAITVEDSFKSCSSPAAAEHVLRILAPDLLSRLAEEFQETGRRAGQMTLKWRHRGAGWSRASSSCPLPATVTTPYTDVEPQAAALVRAAMALLSKHVQPPFDLTLLNLGATNFQGGVASQAIPAAFGKLLGGPLPQAAAQPPSEAPQQPSSGDVRSGRAVARASVALRRAYGSNPQLQPISKSTERALREGCTAVSVAATHAAPASPAAPAPPRNYRNTSAWQGANNHAGSQEEGYESDGAVGAELWDDLRGLRGIASPPPPPPSSATPTASSRSPPVPFHSSSGPPAALPAPVGSGRAEAAASAGADVSAAATAAADRPATGRAARSSGKGMQLGRRVVLHCDVDCFYCQVERLDEPALVGVPLAVRQFNAGGFVAVSYEARAAGVKCGDGVGDAGRASIPWLQQIGAVSLEEARRRCPGLQVRPMRPNRYRQVGSQIHAVLRRFAPDGAVEKASCDDFYLDVTSACSPPDGNSAVGAEACVVGDLTWADVEAPLMRGVRVAEAVRAAVRQELGLAVTCGVAGNKLTARLAGPLAKPDGIAVLPGAAVAPFMAALRIKDIPTLRGKQGVEVTAALGIATVGELAAFPEAPLVARFGQVTGSFLAGLPDGRDETLVSERGPQKSIMAERSFPPAASRAAVEEALRPLAADLWDRLKQDAAEHGRLPWKLTLAARQGYAAPRTRSAPVPHLALSALQPLTVGPAPQSLATTSAAAVSLVDTPAPDTQPDASARPAAAASHAAGTTAAAGEAASAVKDEEACSAIVAAAWGLVQALAGEALGVTRLAVGVAFDGGGAGAPDPAQATLSSFLLAPSTGTAPAAVAAPREALADSCACAEQLSDSHAGSGAAPELPVEAAVSLDELHRMGRMPTDTALIPPQRQQQQQQRQRQHEQQADNRPLTEQERADSELAMKLHEEELMAARRRRQLLLAGAPAVKQACGTKRGPLDVFFKPTAKQWR